MNEKDIGPSPHMVAEFRAERSLLELSTDVLGLDYFPLYEPSEGDPVADQPASITVILKDDALMEGKEHLLISAKKFLIEEFEEQNLSINKLRFAQAVLEYSPTFG